MHNKTLIFGFHVYPMILNKEKGERKDNRTKQWRIRKQRRRERRMGRQKKRKKYRRGEQTQRLRRRRGKQKRRGRQRRRIYVIYRRFEWQEVTSYRRIIISFLI